MKHPERVEDYLEHMVEAIDRAVRYVGPLNDVGALYQNPQVQDAVVRNIEVIVEAANHIQRMDPTFVEQHPELPWVELRGMRNKITHEYFDVDWHILWGTVRTDLPLLREQIRTLLIEQRHTHDQQQQSEQDRGRR